jgi:hypothetical protein
LETNALFDCTNVFGSCTRYTDQPTVMKLAMLSILRTTMPTFAATSSLSFRFVFVCNPHISAVGRRDQGDQLQEGRHVTVGLVGCVVFCTRLEGRGELVSPQVRCFRGFAGARPFPAAPATRVAYPSVDRFAPTGSSKLPPTHPLEQTWSSFSIATSHRTVLLPSLCNVLSII